ncbi:MAG: hypothetical protein LLF76_04630 [Planctomycetaceae bacterium]|nr:hypothetical protein [Planctomycetaceae bacterium]
MIRPAKTFSGDTTPEAAAIQMEVLRKMGPEGRAKLTFDLCENLRQITRAGIRHRHPDYSEHQVPQEYLKLILDKSLFEQIFPNCEILA